MDENFEDGERTGLCRVDGFNPGRVPSPAVMAAPQPLLAGID
jgi:hypothetical protein